MSKISLLRFDRGIEDIRFQNTKKLDRLPKRSILIPHDKGPESSVDALYKKATQEQTAQLSLKPQLSNGYALAPMGVAKARRDLRKRLGKNVRQNTKVLQHLSDLLEEEMTLQEEVERNLSALQQG